MRNIFSLIVIFTFICCDSSGIEGFLNEPITISANNPEEGQDFDYLWTLANQPDGSLINSSDLITSDDGQEMVFTPDYPGNYSIEVVISKYGDNVSNAKYVENLQRSNEQLVKLTALVQKQKSHGKIFMVVQK